MWTINKDLNKFLISLLIISLLNNIGNSKYFYTNLTIKPQAFGELNFVIIFQNISY